MLEPSHAMTTLFGKGRFRLSTVLPDGSLASIT
jgi:hypothetical protein